MMHEGLLLLLRQRPELVPKLMTSMEQRLGVEVPEHTGVHIEEADFSQLVPTEYRADLVLVLRDPRPVMGLVVEVQWNRAPRKRFSWPLYAAALHARLRCLTCLVVVAPKPSVARWAARPIRTLQPATPFAPLVLGPEGIPWVRSAEEARRSPELAVLSAVAHGKTTDGVEVAAAALEGVARAYLDGERVLLYSDLVLATLGEAARVALEAMMDKGRYEYQSDFARKYHGEGKAEGKAESILAVLAARGIPVPDSIRQHIEACMDLGTLDTWIVRAAVASSANEVVNES